MKKLKSLLLVAVTLFALSACNNEIDPVIDNTGDDITGYLTLNISSPEIRSARTAPSTPGEVEDGVGTENTIDNVTVVLTNAAGDITQSFAVASAEVTNGKTKAIKVPTGDHFVYALVNHPTEATVTVGENIKDAIVTVSNAVDATEGFKKDKFFMVNAKHDSADLGNAGISVSINQNHTITSPAQAIVKVDRVVAKIVPKTTTTNTAEVITALNASGSTFLSVDIVGYLPLNVNKQFNLVQKWGMANTNGTPADLGSEALQTPLYDPNATAPALVKNQYFHNISEYTTITKVSGVITSIEDLTKSTTYTELNSVVYATENRPTIIPYASGTKPSAGQGETTGIIYKVQVNDGTGSPSDTFYEYRGKIYTTAASLKTDYDTDNGSNIVIAADDSNAGELRAKGIKVYEKGVMYYTYFIKGTNKNPNHLWGGENYYGVFRNSVYNITVDKINKIGDDVPGGGKVDPEEPLEPGNPPIDTDDAYIQVTVTVNPWVLNDLVINL